DGSGGQGCVSGFRCFWGGCVVCGHGRSAPLVGRVSVGREQERDVQVPIGPAALVAVGEGDVDVRVQRRCAIEVVGGGVQDQVRPGIQRSGEAVAAVSVGGTGLDGGCRVGRTGGRCGGDCAEQRERQPAGGQTGGGVQDVGGQA